MSAPQGPPPGGGSPPAPATNLVVLELEQPSGFKAKLLGKRGPYQVTLTPSEIVVEHGDALRAPLRFAPGSVVVASLDPGRTQIGKDERVGRFPILHRIGKTQVVPREEGIEGWVWTSTDGSAFTVLGNEAPNLAFIFSPPLAGETVMEAFEPAMLADLAKRAPLGEPAVFGLLLCVANFIKAKSALERWNLAGQITDREIPPVQRRHLPDDKPANPAVTGLDSSRAHTSMPPPGAS
jgi:hypothetical protein